MQKSFKQRLAELERLEAEQERRNLVAIMWALEQLTEAEYELFVVFWHRDRAEGGAVAYEGAEADAIARYCALVDRAHELNLTPPLDLVRWYDAYWRLQDV
jgi:hypothetical protein